MIGDIWDEHYHNEALKDKSFLKSVHDVSPRFAADVHRDLSNFYRLYLNWKRADKWESLCRGENRNMKKPGDLLIRECTFKKVGDAYDVRCKPLDLHELSQLRNWCDEHLKYRDYLDGEKNRLIMLGEQVKANLLSLSKDIEAGIESVDVSYQIKDDRGMVGTRHSSHVDLIMEVRVK